MCTRSTTSRDGMSRRAFLFGAASAAAGMIVACNVPAGEEAMPVSAVKVEHLPPALPSPRPIDAATQPAPAAEDPALPAFLALSAVLTGVAGLSPSLGSVYLASVQANPELGPDLLRLLEAGGFADASSPATLEALEAMGLLAEEPAAAVADKVIEYWYSGVYDTADGEQAVATFVDALAWQAITYTKPLTICGTPGYWSEAPELKLD